MITEKELEAVKLSPTKKDFYQIWNELLDTAKKIGVIWDPTSTNEADPGIVLLKVLTAIADKLNYNVDKALLEIYMPSATQEESVRRLCDMLGYSMKYYRSATTPVTISYNGADKHLSATNLFEIPKYTVITNTDNDVSYCLTTPVVFNDSNVTSKQVEAIEGMLESCKVNGNEIISLINLDDNNRFYFPETQIAENGIFIHNVTYTAKLDDEGKPTRELITTEGDGWESVDNLNTQKINSKVFKFGYDSTEKLPYVQFPEDIANIIGDGLFIKYMRTNGVNGNIAARTLNKFQTIDDIIKHSSPTGVAGDTNFADENLEEVLSVANISIAINGANKESINDAYNNYKKTIGTFDTLVSCRDYMNKIYTMMQKDLAPDISMDTTPLVSNIIVSDIRDDINSSYTLCTFNQYGINYVDMTIKDAGKELINNFDLRLYPFTVISNTSLKSEYVNSFKYSSGNLNNITKLLEKNKTISHVFVAPKEDDIACIKNYLKLNAKITTNYKITRAEESVILKNIYSNIYATFNMRQVDFGEEIPFDSILDCIKNADSRIKNVSLDEPIIVTKVALVDGTTEYAISGTGNTPEGDRAYNQLALRNILAGKISLFEYNENFKTELTETKASGTDTSGDTNYSDVYFPVDTTKKIRKLTATYEPVIDSISSAQPLVLTENEAIQFRAPNLRTVMTYPAYVNYFLKLGTATPTEAKYIAKNEEYQLDTGEYLYINYTPASDDGDDAEPISLPLGPGTIVRFNFDCYDSRWWNAAGHYTNKTSGFNFTDPAVKYMYTFGVKEQVEVREPSTIQLGDAYDNLIYIYWQRQDDNDNPNNDLIEFKFDEDNISTDPLKPNYTSYILKEGEYFYYTDANKLDLAVYGNGTKIHKVGNIGAINKSVINDSLTTEDILTQGLAAAIPWVSLGTNANTYLELQEYQFITLTNSDELDAITFPTGTTATKLNYEWKNVDTATYKYSTSDMTVALPTLNFKIGDNKVCWEVRSKLDLNIGPMVTQVLNKYDKIVASDYSDYSDTFEGKNGAISLKANYPVVSSSKETDVTVWKVDPNTGKYTDAYTDFTLKVFKKETLDNQITLNNFGKNLTKISMNDFNKKANEQICKLDTLIPANNFGLIMFYYIRGDENTNKSTYLRFTGGAPEIFNNGGAWWDSATDNYTSFNATINDVDTLTAGNVYTSDDITIKVKEVENNPDDENDNSTHNEVEVNKNGTVYTYKPTDLTANPLQYAWVPEAITDVFKKDSECIIDATSFAAICSADNTTVYYLRNTSVEQGIEGINIIKLPATITNVEIYTNINTTDNNDIIIFGNLDLIVEGSELNKKIDYRKLLGSASAYAQVLSDLKAIDPDLQFYYNAVLDNSNIIDLNENNDDETLSNPYTWYDYNNVNNKFVISEISADDLETGITIAKSSKL